MMHLAVCDDDVAFMDTVVCLAQAYARAHVPGEKLHITRFTSPQPLLAAIEDGAWFDIFLLDVEMPKLNGLRLAAHIRALRRDAVILFLTSHTEFALEGYKVKALRYVCKLQVAQALPEALEAALDACQQKASAYLTLSHYTDVMRVPYRDILYIQHVLRSSQIVTSSWGAIADKRGLKDLFALLRDPRFLYLDRSCLVNVDYIVQISASEVTLQNGERLPVSRKRLPEVRALILQLWGEAG